MDIVGAFRCCVCNRPTFDQEGHKTKDGLCCEDCFYQKVLPARIIAAAGIPELG